MQFSTFGRATALAVVLAASTAAVKAADISGAGATFPQPLYAAWGAEYRKATGNGLIYQGIGSGAGINKIKSKTATFGASDIPQEMKMLGENGLVQWPMVMGGIVAVVNLDGVEPGKMVLNGETLADIFLGKIKTWNDPAIVKLNPDVKLPSAPIAIVHRADASGTTFNFTNYLSKVSPDWKSKLKFGASVEWPVGVGAKGNAGVASNVKQTKDSIGYVEYDYAKKNKLTYLDMMNKDGQKVSPDLETFQAAASNAKWSPANGFFEILSDEPGAKSWPMTAATFILMYKEPQDKTASAEAVKFFEYSFKNGDKTAESLFYVPIPAGVKTEIAKMWKTEIKN